MMQEIDHKSLDEIKQLAADISGNEKRILEHGQKAEAIVKNMMDHSRTGTGAKEWKDINELAEEYLHIAYQGMLTKNNSFDVRVQTDFDP